MTFESIKLGADTAPLTQGTTNVDRVYLGSDIVWPTQTGNVQLVNHTADNLVFAASSPVLTGDVTVTSWNVRPGDMILAMSQSYGGEFVTPTSDTGIVFAGVATYLSGNRVGCHYGYATGGETTLTMTVPSSCYAATQWYQIRSALAPVAADWQEQTFYNPNTPSNFTTADMAIAGIMAVDNSNVVTLAITATGLGVTTSPRTPTGQASPFPLYAGAEGFYLVSGAYSGVVDCTGTVQNRGNQHNANCLLILRGVPAT